MGNITRHTSGTTSEKEDTERAHKKNKIFTEPGLMAKFGLHTSFLVSVLLLFASLSNGLQYDDYLDERIGNQYVDEGCLMSGRICLLRPQPDGPTVQRNCCEGSTCLFVGSSFTCVKDYERTKRLQEPVFPKQPPPPPIFVQPPPRRAFFIVPPPAF